MDNHAAAHLIILLVWKRKCATDSPLHRRSLISESHKTVSNERWNSSSNSTLTRLTFNHRFERREKNTKSSFWNSFVNCVSLFVCFCAEKWNCNFHLRIARAFKFQQQLQQQSVSIKSVSILRAKIEKNICVFPSSNLVQMFWRQFWLDAVEQMPKKVGRKLFVWPKVLSTFPRKEARIFYINSKNFPRK